MGKNGEHVHSSDNDYRQKAEKERRERIAEFADALLDEADPVKGETAAVAVENVDTRAFRSVAPPMTRVSFQTVGHKNADTRRAADGSEKSDHSGHRKRLRELISGVADLSAVSDDVLFEALLSYTTVQKDIAQTAGAAVSNAGSLWRAIDMPERELASYPDMSARTARVVSDVARLARIGRTYEMSIKDGKQALMFFASLNAGETKPVTHVAYLSEDFRVLDVETFRGVKPPKPIAVLSGAYSRNAKAVIMGRKDSMILPLWQNGLNYANELAEALDAAEVVLLDIIVYTGLGYYSLGSAPVASDGYVVYTFTPLASSHEAGELLYAATVENDEEF